MAYITLPQTERMKSGFEAFSEGAQPYLQMAMQEMLRRKMEEQQRQKALETLGIGREQISPQGQEYAFRRMGITDPTNLEQVAAAQKNGIPKFEIPKRFKSMVLDREKLSQLPPGMKVPLGYGMEYNVPSTLGTMPIINITSEGKTEQIGTAPKGARIITPSQMETPEEKIQRAIATERGKEQAKTQQATQESIGEFQGFINQFERSYDELTGAYPSIGVTGVSGYGQRLIASLGEKTGYFPETTAFLREIEPMANKMARTIEGGRVTDEDRKIYADSFANALSAPSQTNVRLASNALLNASKKGGDITSILETLRTSDNEILQGIVGEVEQRIGGQQSTRNVPQVGQTFNNERVINVQRVD